MHLFVYNVLAPTSKQSLDYYGNIPNGYDANELDVRARAEAVQGDDAEHGDVWGDAYVEDEPRQCRLPPLKVVRID